ncbi:MAG: hypothetical protein AAF441_12235 [Pseudomonadota bacterium]
MSIDQTAGSTFGGPVETQVPGGSEPGRMQEAIAGRPSGLVAALRRRATLILTTAAVCAVAALAVPLVFPGQQTAGLTLDLGSAADPVAVERETRKLLSADALLKIVTAHNLGSDPEFASSGPGADGGSAGTRFAADRRALTSLRQAVFVTPASVSGTLTLSMSSQSAEKAVRLLNAIAQSYIDRSPKPAPSTASDAARDHEARLQALETLVRRDELAVRQFAAANNLTETGQPLPAEPESGQKVDIVLAKAKGLEARFEYEQLRQVLSSTGARNALPPSLAGKSIPELREILQARKQRMDRALALISELETRRGKEPVTREPSEETLQEFRRLSSSVADSRRAFGELAAKTPLAGSVPAVAIQAPAIVSPAAPVFNVDGAALSQRIALSLASGLLLGLILALLLEGLRLLRTARPNAGNDRVPEPEPAAPAASATAKTGTVSASARAPNTAPQPASGGTVPQVRPARSQPAAAVSAMPEANRILARISGIGAGVESMSFVLDDPNSERSKSISGILDCLPAKAPTEPARRILVTAPQGIRKNKSAIALNLAFAAGLRGLRTLVVDTDLNSRMLTRMFIEPATFGIVEVLNGITEVEDVIVADPNLPVSFFPCAPLRQGTTPNLPQRALETCLDELSPGYDLIVLDGGQIGAEAYVAKLGRSTDKVILVTDNAAVNSGGHNSALAAIHPLSDKFAGIVVLPETES